VPCPMGLMAVNVNFNAIYGKGPKIAAGLG
jgi:hypothetical protein